MKKPITRDESAHLAAIKHLPCIICHRPPISEAHHITQCGRRLGHYFTLPLCIDCHRGNDGFSGINRSAWDKSLKNQLELLAQTYKALERGMPPEVKKIIDGFLG
jgi:hypothetical protein